MTIATRFWTAAAYALCGIAFAIPSHAAAVPFLSQTPFGQWSDRRQAQGCEEASAIMAVAWARGQTTISKTEGRKQIRAISDWEKKKFGTYVDTSIDDTADRILRQFLRFSNFEVRRIITTYDIQDALRFGGTVMVAVDGRKLGYNNTGTKGGRHHMIVATEFNEITDTFSINDPGIRLGGNIKISREKMHNALQDYPSGDGSSRDILPPAMIVINKTER